jgi:predicted nucleotidyltransferase
MKNKTQVLAIIQEHRDRLNDFSVKELFLFGSVARDEATAESDVDFLVSFNRPVGLFTLLGLKAFLEDLLGCSVDIGTPDSLRPHLRETVLKEVIRAV